MKKSKKKGKNKVEKRNPVELKGWKSGRKALQNVD